jgi:hypothetical protein
MLALLAACVLSAARRFFAGNNSMGDVVADDSASS